MKLVKISALLIALTLSQFAFSKEYVFCNSCFSQDEFKTYTQGYHGNQVGTKVYQGKAAQQLSSFDLYFLYKVPTL